MGRGGTCSVERTVGDHSPRLFDLRAPDRARGLASSGADVVEVFVTVAGRAVGFGRVFTRDHVLEPPPLNEGQVSNKPDTS